VIVSRIWKDCTYQNKRWVKNNPTDAYWLECPPEEFKSKILIYASDENRELLLARVAVNKKSIRPEHPNLCFLVTKDLKSIMCMGWAYPFSSHWNWDSPFESIYPHIIIQDLSELARFNLSENKIFYAGQTSEIR
jgi:hypothetical protein